MKNKPPLLGEWVQKLKLLLNKSNRVWNLDLCLGFLEEEDKTRRGVLYLLNQLRGVDGNGWALRGPVLSLA
ncbi:hypothetical protein V6N12_004305 [Hibiscus sabdariffa]|uniref:Uncharacterized protein n=1 Tax=Hibiscus sabdariffa TaxID=183260 RepID=A0ABR2CL39_9ROSI